MSRSRARSPSTRRGMMIAMAMIHGAVPSTGSGHAVRGRRRGRGKERAK